MPALQMPSLPQNLTWFRNLRWPSQAVLIDWLVVIALGVLGHELQRLPPYRQRVEDWLQDPSLSYPMHYPPTVSITGLWRLTFYLPIALIVLVGGLRTSIHEIHHGVLSFCASFYVQDLVVSMVKNLVGRFRPDFLDRCKYDLIRHMCTGNPDIVDEGRRSFPSGHASSAFCCGVFLFLFFAGKNRTFAGVPFPTHGITQSKLLRACLAGWPLLLAAYIAISRWEDHAHHPSDILVGSLTGGFIATVGYLMWWPSPFHASNFIVMATPRPMYGGELQTDILSHNDANEPDSERVPLLGEQQV